MLNLDLTNCNNPRSNTALTDTDSRHSAWWGHHCILNSLGDEMRWLFPHHATNWLSSPLISASCPSLIHPTTAESSQYLWSLHDSELYWKSEVYRVKRNSESTVPCAADHLLRHTTLQSHKLCSVCQVVNNSGGCGGIHLYFLGLLTVVPVKQSFSLFGKHVKGSSSGSHSRMVVNQTEGWQFNSWPFFFVKFFCKVLYR